MNSNLWDPVAALVLQSPSGELASMLISEESFQSRVRFMALANV